MESPEPQLSTPTAAASSSSPTAARIASGRAVPRPLDLSGSSTPTRAVGVSEADPSMTDAMDAAEANGRGEDATVTGVGFSTAAGNDQLQAAAAADGSDAANTPTAAGEAYTSRDPRRFGNSSFPKRSPRPPATTFASPGQLSDRTSIFNPGAKPARHIGLSYNTSAAPSVHPTPSSMFNAGGANKSAAETGSRFLLTVVPPAHLPHDPPHPRANPQASGYGPPQHFRRGTLVPLYRTLSSQLAAIAREYGLPSSGGLVLYLLSTSDPATQAPLPQAAALSGDGGPRIGEHAWNMLWGQLLAEDDADRQRQWYGARTEYGSEDEGEDADDLPPVPPIPSEHAQDRSRRESIEGGGEGEGESSDETGQSVQASDPSRPPTEEPAVRAAPNGTSASAAAQAALGRGMPNSTPPPGAKQARRIGSLPTLSQRNSSRQSLHAVSARGGTLRGASSSYLYNSMPASAASPAYSHVSYSPSVLGGPSSAPILPKYGSSVVVGKVEFDVHSSTRQGKWYESWLASASSAPPSQPMSQSSSETSSSQLPSSESRQELRLPSMLAHQMPGRRAGFIAQPFTFPRKRDSDVSRVASSDGGEAASTAAGHGHTDSTTSTTGDLEADETLSRRLADRSIQTPRPFHSRKPSSVISRTGSPISPEERPVEDSGYAPLHDGDEGEDDATAPDGRHHVRKDSRQSMSTFAGSDNGSTDVADQANHRRLSDPLGDVFGSDDTAWQSIADDQAASRQTSHDGVLSTGLGISEAARIAGFPTVAGVAERAGDEAAEQDSLPPQDDIADVAALLSPTTIGPPTGSALLASPIRLAESAKEAGDDAGVFTSTSDGEKRAPSFIPTHATRRSISTVNFTVRPPSTIASRSPDELSQRASRQGRTEVAAGTDATMSTSTSISSISALTEESIGAASATASSIGLERNLNDLEQALAALSPTRSFPSRTNAESAPSEPSKQETAGTSTADAITEPAAPQPNPYLASRLPFRYGVSGGSPTAETFAQRLAPASEPSQLDVPEEGEPSMLSVPNAGAGDASTDSGRIPRSSSLRKPESTEPHMIALPPSPIPTASATFSPTTEESQPREAPAIPSASPSWPEPTSLPFGSASPEKTAPEAMPETTAATEPTAPATESSSKPDSQVDMPPAVPVVPVPAPPPTPATKAETPSAATQASPGRSPGRLKKLRTNMWGSKGKAAESPKEQPKVKVAVETPKEPVSEEASGSKSPGLGSFFGRFGKKQPRKSDPSTSAAETTDEEAPLPVAADTPATTDTEVDDAAPSSSHEDSEAKESLEDADDDRVNVAGIGRVRTMSVASVRSPESPKLSLPPFPPSFARNFNLAGSPTNSQTPNGGSPAQTLEEDEAKRAKAVLSPTAAPFVPSAPSTPRPSHRSEDSLSSTSPSAFPPPPIIGGSAASSSQSAPVTPAGWSLSTPRQQMRSKHRLSADIDQLLSQMHDIEFGLDDGDTKEEMRNSVIAAAAAAAAGDAETAQPSVVTPAAASGATSTTSPDLTTVPTSLAYQIASGSASPTSPALQLSSLKQSPLDGAGDDAGERPSSADLLVLGSIMTQNLASPPLSPNVVDPLGDGPSSSPPTETATL
ncbi:hypothetical protein RHOSPDRAFT_32800 [Rhodotorula sp. JG-1b]|nr:hypothetical protein RHOSPDRAFT_32800 [Rhodotorula sp. JG-1b]